MDQRPTAETVEDSQSRFDWLLQRSVIDVHGEDIGKVETVWRDMASGELELIGVLPHWLTDDVVAVPLARVELQADSQIVRVPYALDSLKRAPRHSPHGTLTDDEKTAIYDHFRAP
jgi:sporulation protein YlmC with PRC-barrel domain